MNIKDAVRTLRFKNKIQTKNQLYTEWGEHMNSEHVLEEYPRPQLRRANYTILNGYWNYSINKDASKPDHFDGKIIVPFSPECVLSGVNRQLKPDEMLWYERTVFIKEININKRCILHFGAVDQSCEVWVNNNTVLSHTGGYLPFSIDITDRILLGENIITLKVIDYSDTSYHSRGKQKLKRGGMFYTAQSGIWQTVWLEWVPNRYITSLKITPFVDKSSVQVEIIMNDTKSVTERGVNENNNFISEKPKEIQEEIHEIAEEMQEEYRIDILTQGKVIQSAISDQPVLTIPLLDFEYWSPEHPFLYDMIITTRCDKVESYFAMRKFEIKADVDGISRIYLNNEPYFQNGILDQGYWPDGLYTAPSDEAMIFDISKAKEMGFNLIRKHIKIEPLRWYYHCDRLGMIVWQDMVNGGESYNTAFVGYLPTLVVKLQSLVKDKYYRLFGRNNADGRKEWKEECKRTVELLYNCPSIAVWVPFNEGWGQFDAKEAVEIIRKIDKTRLIDHASGWYDQQAGDFKSIHNYFHKLDVVKGNRAIILSEFGGYACLILNHTYSLLSYGYRIYTNKEDLNSAYQKLYNVEIRLLIKKGLAASVYTQLTDVEDEINGLFTYDRKICKVEKLPKL